MDLEVAFEACVEQRTWDDFRSACGPYSIRADTPTLDVDVNVYSLQHHAEKVGNILLQLGLFLQYPVFIPSGQVYHNPQMLVFDGFCEKDEDVTSEPDEQSTPIFIVDRAVEGAPASSANSDERLDIILNSLSHKGILHELRTDSNRIRTPLMG